MSSRPLRNAVWALIVGAHGHVQGKALHMRESTLIQALREAGEVGPVSHRALRNRTIYGVRVVIDESMSPWKVELR